MPSMDDRLSALGRAVVDAVDFGEGDGVGVATVFEDDGLYDAAREDASV